MYQRGRSCTRHGQHRGFIAHGPLSEATIMRRQRSRSTKLSARLCPRPHRDPLAARVFRTCTCSFFCCPFWARGSMPWGLRSRGEAHSEKPFLAAGIGLRCTSFGAWPMLVAMVVLLSRRCYLGRGFLLKGCVVLVWFAAVLVTFDVQAVLTNLRALAVVNDVFLVIHHHCIDHAGSAYWMLCGGGQQLLLLPGSRTMGSDVVIFGERHPRAGNQKYPQRGTEHRGATGLHLCQKKNFKEGHPTCGSHLFESKFVQGQFGCHHRVPLGHAQCADIEGNWCMLCERSV